MSKAVDAVLAEVTDALRDGLGENLVSCCVYGSAARGNAVEGVSDINLLIVLNESSAVAHAVIARVIERHVAVDPFVLARRNLERTARCFAAKFANIQRHYRVLHGSDLLAELRLDPRLERLLVEQAVRNLRLRLVHAFVTRNRQRPYGGFLAGCVSSIFINLAEILRLRGQDVPKDFADRIPLLQQTWPAGASILRDLAQLREHPRRLADDELPRWHEHVLALLDAALTTIESEWAEPMPPPAA